MPPIVLIVIMAVFFVWIIILTILLLQTRNHYNSLTKDTNTKTLTVILESITRELELAKKDIAQLAKQCDKIEKEGSLHIQKVGLLRFNPFKDTGGDQSFILSLIDAQGTGVVISGLFSRSGTRWYAKKVVQGKGLEHELSADEQKAIQLAK